MKFVFKGYAYHQDYRYDDCCEEVIGWVLVPFQTQLNSEYCSDCEENHISFNYDRKEWKDYQSTKGDKRLPIHYLDADLVAMIEKTLGHDLTNGEYIEATFDVDVITLDSLLLGVEDERRD